MKCFPLKYLQPFISTHNTAPHIFVACYDLFTKYFTLMILFDPSNNDMRWEGLGQLSPFYMYRNWGSEREGYWSQVIHLVSVRQGTLNLIVRLWLRPQSNLASKKHHLASWSRIFDKLNYLSGQTCMRDLQSRVVKFCFLQTFYIYIVNYFVFIKCLLSVISKHFQVQSLKNFVPSGLLRHWLWSPLTLSNVII